MRKKCRIAILFGGASSEYEISLRSVTSILENLNVEKYDPILIGIDQEGNWHLYSGPIDRIKDDTWMKNGKGKAAIITPSPNLEGVVLLSEDGTYQIAKIDVIFPVLHGWGGEDGRLQGLLELSKIPYVGCGVLASASCMDKEVAHVRLEEAGIQMADWFWVSNGQVKAGLGENAYLTRQGKRSINELIQEIDVRFGWPVFIKPCNAGSTVGVSKVSKAEDLEKALTTAFKEDYKLLIEEAIVGQEVECAVFGSANITTSPLGEIITEDFYDYESKYVNQTAGLLVPANLPIEVADEVQRIAKLAYDTMECTGLSRVDFFVDQKHRILLNEINTLPGFTSISMYPRLMKAAGVPYSELIDHLVEEAIERKMVNG